MHSAKFNPEETANVENTKYNLNNLEITLQNNLIETKHYDAKLRLIYKLIITCIEFYLFQCARQQTSILIQSQHHTRQCWPGIGHIGYA
jgi:hypothetical protein